MDVRHTFLRRGAGRSRALIGLTAGALVAGAIAGFVGAGPAQADGLNNIITIETATNSNAKITYYDATGGTNIQTLSNPDATKCEVTSTSPTYVAFSAGLKGSETNSKVGQRFGSLGVAEKSTGESCAQVSATGAEALTLDLGDKAASMAVLDLELQKDALVVATLYSGASSRTVQLQTGRSISGNPQPGLIDQCQVASSSGPNSGPSDNCRWVISGTPFNKVVLTATKGLFSLEGGADGTVNNRTATEPVGYPQGASYFALSNKCSGDASVNSGVQSGLDDKITVTQWDAPTVDGKDCQTTPLIVKAQDGALEFIKNGQPYSQFKVVIDWRYALKSKVTATTVQFGSSDPVDVMAWCPDSVRTGDGVKPLGAATDDLATYLSTNGITDMDPTTDGVQFACTGLKTAATYVNVEGGDDYIAQTETIYLLGDVVWRG